MHGLFAGYDLNYRILCLPPELSPIRNAGRSYTSTASWLRFELTNFVVAFASLNKGWLFPLTFNFYMMFVQKDVL